MRSIVLNIKNVSSLFLITIVIMLFGCNSHNKSPEQIKTELAKSIPGITKIDAVNKSPIRGVYEVAVGRKIFYVTMDGKYLFFGNIVDPVTKTSITEQRTQDLSKIDWNQLPLDLAVKTVNGTGERKLVVFSDPDCPYCKMFEKQVAPMLLDTTIYTFLFPLAMHPNARIDSNAIWCSKDRTTTWVNFMRNGVALPVGAKCDTSDLDKVYKVGTDLVQVEGTPTLILSNGQILPGMLPHDQLIEQMDKANGNLPKKVASKVK